MKFLKEIKLATIVGLSFFAVSRLSHFESDGKLFCFGLIGFVIYGIVIIIGKYKKLSAEEKKGNEVWYAVSLGICAFATTVLTLMLFFS